MCHWCQRLLSIYEINNSIFLLRLLIQQHESLLKGLIHHRVKKIYPAITVYMLSYTWRMLHWESCGRIMMIYHSSLLHDLTNPLTFSCFCHGFLFATLPTALEKLTQAMCSNFRLGWEQYAKIFSSSTSNKRLSLSPYNVRKIRPKLIRVFLGESWYMLVFQAGAVLVTLQISVEMFQLTPYLI